MLSTNTTFFVLRNITNPFAFYRTLDKRFEELGAQRVYPRGEGDDDSRLFLFHN